MSFFRPRIVPNITIKPQFNPSAIAIKPIGSSSMVCAVVSKDMTMMKNSNAVVRIVFCPSLTTRRNGYFNHNLLSVSMQTSLLIKPRNHRRRCLSSALYVCTASVLQKAPVLIPIWKGFSAAIINRCVNQRSVVCQQSKFTEEGYLSSYHRRTMVEDSQACRHVFLKVLHVFL